MITKHGFKNEFARLDKDTRSKVRNDLQNMLGWGYFTFSKKKNGVYLLNPAELILVEEYFCNLER